jgi:phosphate-selective porin OprO/OprP
MKSKPSFPMRKHFPAVRSALAAYLILAAGLPALQAQSEANDIAALRAQIQELDQKLRILERKQENNDAAAATAAAAAARVTLNDRGLTIASPDAANSLRVRGLVQLDHRAFFNDGTQGLVNNAFVLRRARLITEGQFAKNYSFQLVTEFGGSAPAIVDANIGVVVTPKVQLKFGRLKSPVGLELLQSDSWTFFNERSIVTNLVPNRDLGVQASGDVLDGRLNYTAGVYGGLPDAASTNNADFDNEKSFAGRLYATPFKNEGGSALQGLSLGVSGSVGREKTASGRTGGYRTDGQQTFFSYAATTIADGRNWRVSPQAEYRLGSLGLLGEYVVSAVNVRPSATGPKTELRNRAWQLAAGYVLTGENSAYGGVVPKNNFDLSAGTWGAFEVAARYATLDVDDAAFPTFASVSTNADQAKSIGLGLNWYLSKAVRATFDYYHTDFDFNAAAPAVSTTAALRQPEKSFITRLQLTF